MSVDNNSVPNTVTERLKQIKKKNVILTKKLKIHILRASIVSCKIDKK